jgi:hypothetical protein
VKLKIKKLSYHRNGSGGNQFFTCQLDLTEGKEKYTNLIATFETEENELGFDMMQWQTCRVVDPLDITKKFRGDAIALTLQNELSTKSGKYYNLTLEGKL